MNLPKDVLLCIPISFQNVPQAAWGTGSTVIFNPSLCKRFRKIPREPILVDLLQKLRPEFVVAPARLLHVVSVEQHGVRYRPSRLISILARGQSFEVRAQRPTPSDASKRKPMLIEGSISLVHPSMAYRGNLPENDQSLLTSRKEPPSRAWRGWCRLSVVRFNHKGLYQLRGICVNQNKQKYQSAM